MLLACALLAAASASAASAQLDEHSRQALAAARRDLERQPRPPELARVALLRQATILEVALAPDGRHLAYVRRSGAALEVSVRRVSDRREWTVLAGANQVDLHWSADGAHLWLGDEHGLVHYAIADAAGKRIHRWPELRRQRLWGDPRRASDHALVEDLPAAGTDEPVRYWRVDRQGRLALVHSGPAALRQALLRADGSLAFSVHQQAPDFDIVIRHHAAGAQREILRCRGVQQCRIVQHAADGAAAWLESQQRSDLLSLQHWQSGSADAAVLHRDPAAIADLADVFVGASGPLAVAYDDGRRRWLPLQPALGPALADLQRRLPEAGLELATSGDGALWLVRARHETWIEDRHYLYRPGKAAQLEALFAPAPAAPPPEHLAPLLPLHYRASDGRALHGYVLLPRGRVLRDAPLVAWLHGGPASREEARFDARLQLLANRGHIVFLPNFRGSEGFGIGYKLSAQGDVGDGRVLADVLEGLDLLLAAGIGDARRQAVMGHSFGGYLALVAHTHRPARFRFAWAAAPPTDYGWTKDWQARNDTPLLRGDARPLRLSFPLHGYRYEDANWRERMRRESPRSNIGRIAQPVYLWAGARDRHVPLASLAHYAGELARLGKAAVLLVDPDAGHSPAEPLAAEAYLYLLEAASHRHFAGGLAPADAALATRLRQTLRLGAPLLAPARLAEIDAATRSAGIQ